MRRTVAQRRLALSTGARARPRRHRGGNADRAAGRRVLGVLHYLKAVETLRSDDGPKVIAKMKELPTDDPIFGKGHIRADGRKIHPLHLFEVKKPAESKGAWDYYKLRATIPPGQAFRPIDQGDHPNDLIGRVRKPTGSTRLLVWGE